MSEMPPTPIRVLIVEDSEDDALLVLRELKRGGYDPDYERVETPEAMEEALSDPGWDVILSDYRLPRFDAPEALAAARRMGSDVPFIVVSGKVGEEAAVEIMKAGAFDYVMKDNLARLCISVERGMEEAEARRERRRSETRLRESRERYELAVRGADNGLWDWDLRTNTVYYSPRWKSIIGYEDHEIEHRFEEWESRVHPDDRDRAMRAVRDHLDGSAPHYEMEHRLLHKDGSWHWIRARGTSVHDENGKAYRLAGAHWDVTERKKYEENLRRRDTILEAVRFAAERFLSKAAGWERSIEKVLSRLGGAAEASRVYIFENYVGDDGELCATQRYEWVAEGISAQIENPVLKAMPYREAGFGRWVETFGRGELIYGHVRDFPESEQPELVAEEILSIALVPIFVSGEWWGFVGFDECVAEREWSAAEIGALKAAASTLGAALQRQIMEEELREGEERYRAVVEQATDAIFLLDAGTKRLAEANAAFLKMFGYEAGEIREISIYDLVAHAREDIDATIKRTLAVGKRVVGERQYRRKDGTLVDVEVGVSVIVHRGRELICTICRDVTERKKNEEKIRASEAELRALFAAMDDPIFVIDGEGRHIEVAPTNATAFFSPPAEIVGKTLHDIFPSEQADEFLGHVRRALETRRKVSFEYALEIDGGRMWFEGAVSPMLDDSVVWVARDITELKESEERFKGLAEATFEGVAITRDGKVVETNTAFADMFGYKPSEVIGMTPLDVTAPESHKAVNDARDSNLEEPYEAVLLKKDGTTFDSEIRGKMSRYKGDAVRVTAFRDVTERKENEQTLRENEERFRTAFDSAAIGMGLVSPEGRWLRVNRPLCEIVGYSEAELLGLTFQDITHPEDLDNDLRWVERVLRSEIRAYQMEKRYIRKDGGTVWILLSVALVRDYEGEPLYFISQIQDITRRKEAEEALAHSERRLRTIVETEPECVKVLDMDACLVEMNPAGIAMMEADSVEQLRGMQIYDTVLPEYRDDYVALTEKVLRGGSGTLEFEGIGLKGGRGWLETHAVPLRDARGDVSGLLGVTRDITERKHAEEALKESQRTLATLMGNLPGMAYRCGNDEDWTMQFVNEGCLELTGYSPGDLIGNRQVSYGDLIHADDAEMVWESVQAALRERRPFQITYRITTASGEIKWVWEQGQGILSPEGELLALEGFVTDTTERKKNEEALKESERLYRTVIEQATENIFLVDVETRRIVQSNPAFRESLGYSEEELRGMTLYDIIAESGESVDRNIRLTRQEGSSFVGERKYRRKDGSLLNMEVSGSIILHGGRQTLCAVAHDVTERARAQARLEERVTTLSRVSASLTLELPMQGILDALAMSVVNASTAVACLVALYDEEAGCLRMESSHGMPEGYRDAINDVWRNIGLRMESPTARAFLTRRPALVRDMNQILLGDEAYAPVHRFIRRATWDTVFIVPLVSRGRAVGAINFGYRPGGEPGEDEQAFLSAVADQAAVAVENARLFADARGKAALEERQRLARELHDSVSQALYGIVLGTRTARTLVERSPERAADPLDYVLSLAEAGLDEMRALIFELRPESLEREGVIAALEKQAAALRTRHELEVEAMLCEEPDVALEIKETIYRVAQEALHNTVKHARAGSVKIKMDCAPDYITLDVSDDGVGFDTGGDFPGHLGLRSMRERVSRLGGTLEITSASGCGARVHASIPCEVASLPGSSNCL